MTRTRRLTAAATAAGLVTVLAATPAAAAPPVITFATPAPGARVATSAMKVDAKVTMPDGRLKSIALSVTPLSGGGAPVNPAPLPGSDAASKDVSFSLSLPYNGRYKAEITATGNDSLLGLGQDTTRKGAVEFALVAPPVAPRNVRTSVDAATREVTIAWAANTEPDLLFYLVQRSAGGGEFALAAKTTELTVVDTVPAATGGDFTYQVIAVRAGAVADEGINSNPSAATAAAVAAPVAPPTTVPATPGETTVSVPASTVTTAPGTTAPPPTPTTTASTIPPGNPGALSRSGTVDLSGLRALQAQPAPAPRVSPPTTADTGFEETLPFDTSAAPEDTGTFEPEGGTEFDESAFDENELGAESDIEKTRALAFLAAGLLATVLLMHLLWVRGEVDRAPLEALTPAPSSTRKQKRPKRSAPPAGARPRRPAPRSGPGGRPGPGPRPKPGPPARRPRPGPDPRLARPRPDREDLPIG